MKGHVYGIIAVVLIVIMLLTGLRTPAMFRLGIENIPKKFEMVLQKKSTGLISNRSARDQNGSRSLDILLAHGINVNTVFVPEHQFSSASFVGDNSMESLDELTGVPCVSLYDKSGMRTLCPQMLENIDVLLFDLPNSGMRYHGYVSIMLQMMELAQQQNKMFVVFDRPNPLGCAIEGPLVDYNNRSCLAALPIPVRHGLTVGELAWYCNMYVLKHPANLVVVKMAYYDRSKDISCTNVSVESQDMCMRDSFLGLLKEISPFHVVSNQYSSMIMLPENKGVSRSGWLALAHKLEKLSIISEYNQCGYASSAYSGLKITINDINQVSLFQVFAELFSFCHDYNITLSFSDYFNRVMGASFVNNLFQNYSCAQISNNKVGNDLDQFYTTARASFMYMPLPQICN